MNQKEPRENVGRVRDCSFLVAEGDAKPMPADRALGTAEVAGARAGLWSAYKAAAIELGWDREIAEAPAVPKLPPVEEFQKMPAEKRPKVPEFKPSVIPCGEERMPYLLLTASI